MPYKRESKVTGLTMSRHSAQATTHVIPNFSVTLSGFIMCSLFNCVSQK